MQPQNMNTIEQTYSESGLMYIRFEGKIIKKPGGKRRSMDDDLLTARTEIDL